MKIIKTNNNVMKHNKKITSLSSFDECKLRFMFIKGLGLVTNFLALLVIGSSSSQANKKRSLYCLWNKKNNCVNNKLNYIILILI